MSEDLYQRGMKVRRKVLGDAHVERAEANKTPIDQNFQRYITQAAWGSVWGGDGIAMRERSLITIALLAGLGHHEELVLHIRATKNTGVTLKEIEEVLMHVAVYAGVPAANSAFAIVKKIAAEEGL